MAGASTPLTEPTQDERTMATLAHALMIIGAWIAPLIIFLIKRDSKFVSFHALQALLYQIALLMIWMVFMAAWMGMFFGAIFRQGATHGQPPAAFFIFFPFIWLGATGIGIVTVVVAIVYAIKAGRGEWAEYPVLGGLARKILHI